MSGVDPVPSTAYACDMLLRRIGFANKFSQETKNIKAGFLKTDDDGAVINFFAGPGVSLKPSTDGLQARALQGFGTLRAAYTRSFDGIGQTKAHMAASFSADYFGLLQPIGQNNSTFHNVSFNGNISYLQSISPTLQVGALVEGFSDPALIDGGPSQTIQAAGFVDYQAKSGNHEIRAEVFAGQASNPNGKQPLYGLRMMHYHNLGKKFFIVSDNSLTVFPSQNGHARSSARGFLLTALDYRLNKTTNLSVGGSATLQANQTATYGVTLGYFRQF